MTMGELVLALAAVLLVVLVQIARGDDTPGVPHQHPPHDVSMHEKFYSTWMRPDNPNMSCCDKKDCYATEARSANGQWSALQRETGTWVVIPPEKIELHRDNPDGRNHVCMSPGGNVFCFIAGTGI